jgi:P-type Ca2+ transporter type 2C
MTDGNRYAASPARWHVLDTEQTVAELRTDAARGLSADEVARRQAESGPNELLPPVREPAWRMFLSQFNDFMIWVLMAAVAISAFEGEVLDAIVITAILLLNGVLGFVQEYRANEAMAALERMAAPSATVIRDGVELEVPAAALVPGDIVLLESGDKVPADGRLLETAALRIEEASLTGESRPSSKVTDVVEDAEAVLGDRSNLVFAGTSVAVGRGRFVVTDTGQRTEMGRIADLLAAQEDEQTPLQKELDVVGKRIGLLVLAVAGVVFAANAFQQLRGGHDLAGGLTTALLVAISLAVAAIPEGLPAIVTVALSLGVRRMAERNAIVKRLHAVETLGSTTFICSDKTGTLTKNEMTVRRIIVGDRPVEVLPGWTLSPAGGEPDAADLELLLQVAASCNDAHFTADGQLVGDPTETALIVAADALASGRVRPRRLAEVPFDSARKRMTTVHALHDGARAAFMKGGADVVLALCTRARLAGLAVPMDEALCARLSAQAEELASSGYRTLALAWRELAPGEPGEDESVERDMTFIGVVGIVDPPRAEVAAAIAECHGAGIHVAMVTGDHALTARAVGAEIGLLEGKAVVTGAQLERMTDEELYETVEDIRIYARVDPEHKLRIVDALKRRGHVVAMTGDGVNDAPALKKADIGVAMGRVGTDVSREAADMVLADDDFATIVTAVREGRVVFDNLRKFILFLLSCNMSEVLIVFITTFLAPEPALRPLQLLWINLITDGLPALALGVDPPSSGVMERGPRAADEGILTPRNQANVVWQGAAITLAGLAMWIYAEFLMPNHSPGRAQTMLFTAMVLAQLLHAFSFRSATRTVFSLNSLKNRWLVYALLGSMTLQALAIYLPPLQKVFNTVPLSAFDWLMVLFAALVPTLLIDMVKVLRGRRTSH